MPLEAPLDTFVLRADFIGSAGASWRLLLVTFTGGSCRVPGW